MTDVCPGCGGVADNGHDRCVPPNVYLCSKCESRFTSIMSSLPPSVFEAAERKAVSLKVRRAELVWQAYLVAIADENLESFERSLLWAERAVDAFLKWEEEWVMWMRDPKGVMPAASQPGP